MARVSVADWIRACNSKHGPPGERERHVILLLASMMHKGPDDGCYPGQRTIARMIPCSDHKTAGIALRWLRENGWVDATPRRSQFGRPGYTWRPSIPNPVLAEIAACRDEKCEHELGGTEIPQSAVLENANGGSKVPQCESIHPDNGESSARIGELRSAIGGLMAGIGGSMNPPESESLYQKDLTPTRDRQQTRNVRIAKPMTDAELAAKVAQLAAIGYDAAQICKVLGPHSASFDRVEAVLASCPQRSGHA